MLFSKKRSGALVLAGAVLATGAALAQQPRRPAQPAQPAPQAQPAQPAQPAQQQNPSAPVRVDLQPSQADWTKVCGKDPGTNKEICYTTRDFGQAPDQPPVLALAVYDVKGDDTKIIRLLLPPALMLRPGFRFTVDKGAAIEGAFEICFPNGCFAESKVATKTIDQIKKGTTMNVMVKNQFNGEVTFGLPLANFGKAFDGPPIDPKVLEEQQKQLTEELQRRAEEERKRLEAQQGGPKPATPAPAPAAPAPAPAPAPAK
jgi:invasion protein IalB